MSLDSPKYPCWTDEFVVASWRSTPSEAFRDVTGNQSVADQRVRRNNRSGSGWGVAVLTVWNCKVVHPVFHLFGNVLSYRVDELDESTDVKWENSTGLHRLDVPAHSFKVETGVRTPLGLPRWHCANTCPLGGCDRSADARGRDSRPSLDGVAPFLLEGPLSVLRVTFAARLRRAGVRTGR
jgi:hypothetical protein